MRERPGIRVAHNDPISDTPERILRDLIAEIKEEFIELPDGATESCVHPCVYRAEARLRGGAR